ncbi:hypothetical protein MSLAZ_3156 [Methanosarcina lacustris Z-7289]|uniref:Uncharacterized protein n=1 Tax=Methanosarcina lacustris Z-7289 TaxID=1434111 RepID=A0A0E3S9W1_9EURY|nr:Sjogren's syndrome/scleroderma autoantigen 1 family protein [Methanosarcina lacustris]AKB76417.1 hypothetical protein MSLAZ_3156 [Methanosarcina lacustris Z-7289]
MDSEKDQKVKRIARFLELGGTMLAEHCKVCGAPKFRYQGTVICPICDVREEKEGTPTPEPAAEVQVPEARASSERDRSSFEARKKVQARRPKARVGQRTPDLDDEDDEDDEVSRFAEEEIPESPYEVEAVGKQVPETPAVRAGKRTGSSTVSTVHGDREVLESLLFNKMVSVAASLQDEKNPRSIAEQFDLIEKGIGLIERLRQV